MPKYKFTFITVFLIVSFACGSGFAQAKKKEKITVFEVPTMGKIMDVEYRPEFDEWWVKCREGDHISVYLYRTEDPQLGQGAFYAQKDGRPGKKKGKDNRNFDFRER